MRLIIDGEGVNLPFIMWLTKRFRDLILSNLHIEKIMAMQQYLNKHFPKYKVNLIKTLMYATSLIRYKKVGLHYIIYFDTRNKSIGGMLLDDVLKFINDGNAEIDGCGIISNAFLYIEQNLGELIIEYTYINGGV